MNNENIIDNKNKNNKEENMKEKIYKIKGMHCASCAHIIDKEIEKLPNVLNVNVNYASEKLQLKTKDNLDLNILNSRLKKFGYSLEDNNREDVGFDKNDNESNENNKNRKEINKQKNKLKFILPFTFVIFLYMIYQILSTFFSLPKLIDNNLYYNITLFLIASMSLFWVGYDYLLGLFRFIRYGKANMDTLVGMGTSVAYLYSFFLLFFPKVAASLNLASHSHFGAVIVIIGFISLGKYLEKRSKSKTESAIKKLLNLQAKKATIVKNGQEREVSLNDVSKGDQVICKPGEKIAVDGEVIKGMSYIDESMITGESVPVKKEPGVKVFSGTINTNSVLLYRAEKIGKETLLSSIIKLVESAQGSKAPIESLTDKISSIFVPIVLVIATLSLILWLTLGSHFYGFSSALTFALSSFVAVLVIACPCALGLATPTAIIVGVGKGAQNGILIKDAKTLQDFHKSDMVVFDKTGTVTEGKPSLDTIDNVSNLDNEEILKIAASLENLSQHPIAGAIVESAKNKDVVLNEVTNFLNHSGEGISGQINNIDYLVSSPDYLEEKGVKLDNKLINSKTEEGKIVVILSSNQKVLAYISVFDKIKKEAKLAIDYLHRRNIKTLMLSGDNLQTTSYIARKLNIDNFRAKVMPEDKLIEIKKWQDKGLKVAMLGDGINDAPALAQADTGISMSTGTDVAIESAGIILLKGDLSKLVRALNLSSKTMQTVKLNLFWAFIYNIIGIPIATGIFYPVFSWMLPPAFAGLAMAFSSVSVVLNSLALKYRKI